MIGDNKERWQELCEQAAKGEDSAELLAIVREINDLIDAKHNRLSLELPPRKSELFSN